jgi:FkbM family methyltransferase
MQSKTLLKKAMAKCGFAVMRHSAFCAISNKATEYEKRIHSDGDIALLTTLPVAHAERSLKLLNQSRSQLRQDIFVLSELGFKTDGFFVEFGATNGVDLSNTHLLEKEFGWTGILAEPAKCWHEQLHKTRKCQIVEDCVWKETGHELMFQEVESHELSTLRSFGQDDNHAKARESCISYPVRTISLLDMLKSFNAPPIIDYLSIDTEGSEFEILRAFDFSKYQFRVITCEHNYTPMRAEISRLLSQNGYIRKFEHLSNFDDWFVLQSPSKSPLS